MGEDIYAGRDRAVGSSLGQFRAMNAQGNLRQQWVSSLVSSGDVDGETDPV